ncbi:YdcF family protein [Tissierella creatinini]|nr:YdcF family protein [Tissierella creatinini]TJX61557.1 YdcF family protein [Soehngenia saccharolytica]
MKKKNHRKIIIAFIVLVIILALSFPRLGQWLVAEDDIVKSDIIVVLMGSVPDRILQAVDLYQEGEADKIVVVNSHRVAYDELLGRDVEIPGDAQLSKTAANSLGIPNEDIIILEGDAKSTQDEALAVREFLRSNDEIDSMILVTSKYHSARAKKIFTRALDSLNRDIGILSSPTKYDSFNAKYWWRNREDAKRVITEYMKLVNFYVREQFEL